jgi:hypothetical protein
MSSTYLTSDDMTMIERLLAEARIDRPYASSDVETAQARLLIRAIVSGTPTEAELRDLLAEYVQPQRSLAQSYQRWENEGGAPDLRQERVLPSPKEESNSAVSIDPMATASNSGQAIIARNAIGETSGDAPGSPHIEVALVASLGGFPMPKNHEIPPDVRAAIGAFLNECQKEARPFAASEALGAIRGIFPGLEISDSDLMDALTSEASTAGFDIDYDVVVTSETAKRKSLERWDNEGGAIGKPPRTEAQRRKDNDTNGTRRRAKGTKDRNQLI